MHDTPDRPRYVVDPVVRGLADRRVTYEPGRFDVDQLAEHPLAQFLNWYADAVAAGSVEPNAMTLATSGPEGPSARTILLKQADARGFVFFTNYTSRKAQELGERSGVALVFPWLDLHRQVSVRGVAERTSPEESAAYFSTRPWESRIGAWASHQSRAVTDRAALEARYAELARRWPDTGHADDVPTPPHWGGFLIRAVDVEFWQGRPSRLHDRLAYCSRTGRPAALDDPAGWRVERREP